MRLPVSVASPQRELPRADLDHFQTHGPSRDRADVPQRQLPKADAERPSAGTPWATAGAAPVRTFAEFLAAVERLLRERAACRLAADWKQADGIRTRLSVLHSVRLKDVQGGAEGKWSHESGVTGAWATDADGVTFEQPTGPAGLPAPAAWAQSKVTCAGCGGTHPAAGCCTDCVADEGTLAILLENNETHPRRQVLSPSTKARLHRAADGQAQLDTWTPP
eukprot:TRINITY_DN45040_c0_g1_i2.p1 TRINITY_DN45040_c0_g1~~TRINITY_DN45040_c0_g1_i2.p1  ORF type:complete len:221 (+),score=50.66 TRINITY_DN45040_c0_g1_i2:162-824(+)